MHAFIRKPVFWLGLILSLWTCAEVGAQVVLSEFQASNLKTFRDEDGNFEDWIELYNTNSTAVDLGGWYLTDDSGRLNKWQFPNTNLASGQFLVVFASNKDRRTAGSPLHTNFKLSSGGEYLALVKPDGVTIATAYAPSFPPQADDVSYGLPVTSLPITLLARGAGARLVVPPNGALGTNWTLPAFNDQGWAMVKTGVGFDLNNSLILVPVADSTADWSAEGVQGFRGWSYGYYNKTADVSPGFQTNDFVPFPRSENDFGPKNYWTGSQYRWPSSTSPWDTLGQAAVYPNGTNSGPEHWIVRRWQSSSNAVMQARWRLSKTSPNGAGVTGQLYVNGVLKDYATIDGGDLAGVDREVMLGEVRIGDLVDLVVAPEGPGGAADDGGDAAANSLTISSLNYMTGLMGSQVAGQMCGSNASAYLRLPFVISDPSTLDGLKLRLNYNDGFVAYLNGVQVVARNAPAVASGGTAADSVADWSSTGQQGFNNWYYGFYDQSADSNGVYDPTTDFNSASTQWSWNGGAWVLGLGDPPWDMISMGGWRPNGTNSGGVHWPIRRWISDVAGQLVCRIDFRKENVACGNGATLRVFQNGVQLLSWTSAFADAAGLQTNLAISSVQPGDYLDFALDPKGTDGSRDDSCDVCTFAVVIEQLPSDGPVWNSAATICRTPQETSVTEEISISANRSLLVAGTNVLAIHALNCGYADRDFLILPELVGTRPGLNPGQHAYFAVPTPGAANGAGAVTIGPIIDNVSHAPSVPGNNDDLIVTARVTPSLRPVRGVTLKYRVMYSTELGTAMYDDGLHGDGGAGDGVYGATIPANASFTGQMVRYYIVATDTNSQTMRLPAFTSLTRSPQYFGTVVYDPTLTNSRLPILHWFIQTPSAADSDVTAPCSVFFNGEFYDNVGVNIHGQSTRGFPKKSYDFDFNPGFKFRWSESAPRVGDLNLLTTWADKTHLRNMLAHDTYHDAGGPSHFAFAVRVQQNTAFYSVANLVESGDDDFLERLGLDPQGALYKMNNAADSVAYAEKKTRKNEGTADLQALINGLGQASASARETYMYDNLNLPEVINFLAAKAITADVDCCYKNYYLYRDSDGTGEWQAMPWDVDLSFGRVWTCGATTCLQYFDETIYTSTGIFVGDGNRVISPVYATPATRQMFLRRLRTLMDTLLQPPGTPATNDLYRLKTLALRDPIAPDARIDLAKWGTWGTRETITQAVNRVWNEFLPGRRGFMFRTLSVTNGGEIPAAQASNAVVQIDGLEYRPSSGNPLQEWLSLTNANNYAVDISNWRLEGGVRFEFKGGTVIPARSGLIVSPDAKAFRSRTVSPKGGERRLVVGPYEGNLSAWGESLVLRDAGARLVHSNSYVGNPSSAQRYLRITEIFYNPNALASNTNLDAQRFEFLELRNIGPLSLDLRGVRFTDGVQFDFTSAAITNLGAGGRVLVVRDTNAFTVRYGSGLPVAGQFVGALDNGGDRLRLEDKFGEKILDFSYDNTWYPITDGHGYSLVIVDDALPWSVWGEKTSWRPNGVLGGKPGQIDPLPPDFPAVVINEILAHTDPPQVDAVELYNPAVTNVNVGHWYLTDDFDVPRKYRIPNPTIIPPGGYVYFTEAQFNPIPGIAPSFGLNSEGDDVWLFSADTNANLTGYVQGIDFGATANGISLGRYTNSVGEIDYVPQIANTLGRTNAGPLVGLIVLSEIMYHPGSIASNLPGSYVELANVAAVSVPLFNPAEPTNTWRLRNAVEYDFPTNVSLSAGGRLLVVGFDPLTNGTVLTNFRALYGVPSNTPIYGPWQGRLGNGEETIELKKPDFWGTNSVPYVLVEKAHYRDQAPWPTNADGTGFSLQRQTLSAYANDPTNWFASAPTAGRSNHSNLPPTIVWTVPAARTVCQLPTNIWLAATASDSDGTVQRVQFRADGQVLGEALAEPYTFIWTNPPPGEHSLTALAVDDYQAVTESSTISILVVPPPPAVTLIQPLDRTVALVGTTLNLVAEANSWGLGIDRVGFCSDDLPFAQMYAPPYTATLSAAEPMSYALTAVAVDLSGGASTSAVVRVAFTTGSNAPTSLVASGSVWKYLDDGTDQGTNWFQPGFDDTTWRSGAAELGYGDSADGRPEATAIRYGTNANQKWVTYYFRQAFTITQADSLRALTLSLLRDDGAIVYLNGVEVFRSNMPEGPAGYLQLALNAVSGAEETNYVQQVVDVGLLREGTNVLAAEVHQASRDSSDLSFDLALTGTRSLRAPAILTQPASQAIPTGGRVLFEVDAVGSNPLGYQWRRDGTPIQGATKSALVLTNTGSGAEGSYQVVISNLLGSVLSAAARLTLTNAPPQPGADGWLVRQGQTASVTVSSLLSNDVDLAGLPLSVAAVTTPSYAGAAISRSASLVFYQPVPGFLGSDWFTYSVTNAVGLPAVGRVDVFVYDEALPSLDKLDIITSPAGYRIRFRGAPGQRCELQRSVDLTHWRTLLTDTIPAHGMVDYLESSLPAGGAYYRVQRL